VLTCQNCGQANADDFRFCGKCGAPLAATRVRVVRKTVTVLFADVTGSTRGHAGQPAFVTTRSVVRPRRHAPRDLGNDRGTGTGEGSGHAPGRHSRAASGYHAQ
jgi:Double zinc ribbon